MQALVLQWLWNMVTFDILMTEKALASGGQSVCVCGGGGGGPAALITWLVNLCQDLYCISKVTYYEQ